MGLNLDSIKDAETKLWAEENVFVIKGGIDQDW